jgi:methionyl-tRNA formyltransferase
MRMDAGIDTGPILNQRSIPIQPVDTAETLSARLAEIGADLLSDTLPGYLRGEILPQPQPEQGATYAPMLKKEDGLLNFDQTAEELERRVRAYTPWPGAYMILKGQPLKILRAHADLDHQVTPAKRMVHGMLPAVGAGGGILVLDEIQPAGKKPMSGEVFLRGARDWGRE